MVRLVVSYIKDKDGLSHKVISPLYQTTLTVLMLSQYPKVDLKVKFESCDQNLES